jgi:hypothetical protein
MASKRRNRKLRSLKPRHGRAVTFCGAPCDLDKGEICSDCKEWRNLRRNNAGRYEGSGT